MEIAKLKKRGRLESLSPNTARYYSVVWSLFKRFLNGREPTIELAQEFLEELLKELKPNSIAVYGYALKKVLNSMGIEGELLLPSLKRSLPEYLEEEELKTLISICKNPLEKVLLIVLTDTGLRISELFKLSLKDVDFKEGFIFAHREKTGMDGWIPISEKALQALKEYIEWRGIKNENQPLFDYSYKEIWKLMKELGKRANINLHPHLLRHTAAALRRIKFDQPIEDLGDLLGHKSIQTTRAFYANIKPKALKEKIKPII